MGEREEVMRNTGRFILEGYLSPFIYVILNFAYCSRKEREYEFI